MRIIFSIALVFYCITGYTQSVVPFRGDTIRFYKQGGSAELLLQNSTKDVNGVLVNIGGGKTRFLKSKVLDSTRIVIGLDTLTVPGGTGGGEIVIPGFAIQKVGTTISVDTAALPTTNLYKRNRFISGFGTITSPLSVPDLELKYANVSTLRTATDTLATGSFIQTNGYYVPGDGGGARFEVINDTTGLGLVYDTASLIKLSGGRWARVVHEGTMLFEQFGMKGDGSTNDYPFAKKMIDYARKDRSLARLLGTYGKNYRMFMRSAFSDDSYFYLNFGGLEINGNGAKITFDNNAAMSRVYYTIGGVTSIYRAKKSHASSVSNPPNNGLSFYNEEWQLVQAGVTPDGTYPTWSSAGVTYYGAQSFCNIGVFPFLYAADPTIPKVRNITWKNWEITTGEADNVTNSEAYWNIKSHGMSILDAVDNIAFENLKMHNIPAEIIYGYGTAYVKRIRVSNCELWNGADGISTGGEMLVENTTIYNQAANCIESNPVGEMQTYRGLTLHNAKNGIALGTASSDENFQSKATIENCNIYDCYIYGILATRRLRGLSIHNNIIYDNSDNIGIVQQSSSWADALGDISITNNTIGTRAFNTYRGIFLSSDHGVDTMRTMNIVIKGNRFTALSSSYIAALNKKLSYDIYIAGDKFTNIEVSDNTDFYPASVEFLHREVGAALVPITMSSNTKQGWTTTNYFRAYMSQFGDYVGYGGIPQTDYPLITSVLDGKPKQSWYNSYAPEGRKVYQDSLGADGVLRHQIINEANGVGTDYMSVYGYSGNHAAVAFSTGPMTITSDNTVPLTVGGSAGNAHLAINSITGTPNVSLDMQYNGVTKWALNATGSKLSLINSTQSKNAVSFDTLTNKAIFTGLAEYAQNLNGIKTSNALATYGYVDSLVGASGSILALNNMFTGANGFTNTTAQEFHRPGGGYSIALGDGTTKMLYFGTNPGFNFAEIYAPGVFNLASSNSMFLSAQIIFAAGPFVMQKRSGTTVGASTQTQSHDFIMQNAMWNGSTVVLRSSGWTSQPSGTVNDLSYLEAKLGSTGSDDLSNGKVAMRLGTDSSFYLPLFRKPVSAGADSLLIIDSIGKVRKGAIPTGGATAGASKVIPDANYVILSTDDMIVLPQSASARTLTLPAASTMQKKVIIIRNMAASSSDWILSGTYVQSNKTGGTTEDFTNSGLAKTTYELHSVLDGATWRWFDLK